MESHNNKKTKEDSNLVQGCLRHRVVLYPESVPGPLQLLEDQRQGEGWRQLELHLVEVLLLQGCRALEDALDERTNFPHGLRVVGHAEGQGVAVAVPREDFVRFTGYIISEV